MRGAVFYGRWGVGFEERAMPTAAVIHIAIQEQLDGKAVDFMERVSEEQYRKEGCFGRHRSGSWGLWKPHRRA